MHVTDGWPTFSKVGEPMISCGHARTRILESLTSKDMDYPAERTK